MSCKDTQDLIHGYGDGKLDLLQNLQIERHLSECYECAEMLSAQRALRAAIRARSSSLRTQRQAATISLSVTATI